MDRFQSGLADGTIRDTLGTCVLYLWIKDRTRSSVASLFFTQRISNPRDLQETPIKVLGYVKMGKKHGQVQEGIILLLGLSKWARMRTGNVGQSTQPYVVAVCKMMSD